MANVLVSACLLGLPTRYDGAAKPDRELLEQLRSEGHTPIPVCPEQLGGLPTPRPPAEIDRDDGQAVLAGRALVVTLEGRDVTECYLRGADAALRIARLLGCRAAWLKENSPACGVHRLKRGERAVPGRGVAAARLEAGGVEVFGR